MNENYSRSEILDWNLQVPKDLFLLTSQLLLLLQIVSILICNLITLFFFSSFYFFFSFLFFPMHFLRLFSIFFLLAIKKIRTLFSSFHRTICPYKSCGMGTNSKSNSLFSYGFKQDARRRKKRWKQKKKNFIFWLKERTWVTSDPLGNEFEGIQKN